VIFYDLILASEGENINSISGGAHTPGVYDSTPGIYKKPACPADGMQNGGLRLPSAEGVTTP
jgi:hypothetical protein